MMLLLFTFLLSAAWGNNPPVHWTTLIEIQDRHEFYQENEVIDKPKDAWQTLFGVVFPDRNLQLFKDCVYYKVPGETEGIFKIKSVKVTESCEKHMDEIGEMMIVGLKAMQFSFGSALTIHFTFSDYRILKWSMPLMNQFKMQTPAAFTSSAHYRAPKLTLLAPAQGPVPKVIQVKEKGNLLCHSIGDDCAEISPSTCQQCTEGWYEIPNGCVQGPKYCGTQACGQRNGPACRRGMKYQRKNKKFECSIDTSFAYCGPGLSVQCEGSRALCR